MTDAASLAFWTRVERNAYGRFLVAHASLRSALHDPFWDGEMFWWGHLIRAHRAWVWADIHRCMAERPRSALWYVKAGA